MKFQILSDVHTEHHAYNHLPELINPEADALILAGDIVTPSSMHKLKSLKIPTYFILGNHEYYGGDWFRSLLDYQEYFKGSNIHVLENDRLVIPDTNIRVIGASLWTDFLAPTVIGKQHHGNACTKGMSDFFLIKDISVSKWEDRHDKSLKFIMNTLISIPHSGTTIVVTHHAPSFQSSHPIYINSPISGGFCSELSYEIMELQEKQPQFWIHGHCHESFDYQLADTRVICNPRGYPHELNPDFNPDLIIEL